MYVSHVDVTMPCGGEELARAFYGGHLGLREVIRPGSGHGSGEIWFDAAGMQLHLSVEKQRAGTDTQRHFGLGCGDLEGLKARLKAAGLVIEDGPHGRWKRFFTYDPFGNRIEIHQPRAS